ncbi:MarR family winged helix-turn-helix transcriptional regulator [Massilibacterium senegalense]|uniref:MarR family winged helix-turn-helix transcriptional regulator n=1 Tax=Massilibacterium senegalense TaxID=1632858 RepID=UPI00078143C5|nr:MarR family transcriptional regulator [Massilibacterium senegalense]
MKQEEKLRLDQQLCFTIYALSREITKLYRPHLEQMNITYPQYLVLLVLWEETAISMKVLGERLHLDSGTLTPMLKRMEAAGLVKRERAQEDERVVMVVLTEKGVQLQQKAICIPDLLLGQVGMDNEQFQTLLPVLQQLLHTVHAQNEKEK